MTHPTIETHHALRPGYPAMMVHEFVIGSERTHWSRVYDVAACGVYTARSLKSSAAHKLARTMVAAGEPDGPIYARGSDGRLRYRVNSLHAFARFTISENPRPTRIRYHERVFPSVHNAISGQSEGLDDE